MHAFADGAYDRSSFHICGYAESCCKIASFLATYALHTIYEHHHAETTIDHLENNNNKTQSTSHPYVGIVDHVSVMPLLYPPSHLNLNLNSSSIADTVDQANQESRQQSKDESFVPSSAHGKAAFLIGQAMTTKPLPLSPLSSSHQNEDDESNDINLFYYGNADPNNTSLAHVRKHKTSFFKSGGLSMKHHNTEKNGTDTPKYGTATVGAPLTFVENFNIRLRPGISRSIAISLARRLRETDGINGKGTYSGLPGVEALTLPYTNNRLEVACNLLQPMNNDGNNDAIVRAIQQWEEQNQKYVAIETNEDKSSIVECAYRVGTTEENCWNVLLLQHEEEKKSNEKDDQKKDVLMTHDINVAQNFKKYILG